MSTYDERQAQRIADVETLRRAAERLSTATLGSIEAAMGAVFTQWARAGRLDPGMLARVGGSETVALARRVLADEGGGDDAQR